ncbi:E3 ubiquitin/ISG15 ligase TRIM25-like [Mantella aurantiaca]
MAERILEAELLCPVCLNTYHDPVSLSCGHCFCKACITKALNYQSDRGRSYTCPMCQAHYKDFPTLLKNLQLSSIVENYLTMQKNPEDCQIPCGDCLDHPNVAVKTCVTCEVVLCQKHLERHIKKGHTLLEPNASVQERKCSDHDKLLEYYCEEDRSLICVTCYIAGSHKGHTIVTLKQAHEKQLATFSATTSTLSASVSAFCKDIKDLQCGLEKITKNTARLFRPLDDLRDQILLRVKNQFKKNTKAILTEQAQTTAKMKVVIKHMEDAKETTEKALKELNLLSKQADDLLFIKDFNRLQPLISQQSPQINTMQVFDVEANKTMIEDVNQETDEYIANISQNLDFTHNVLSQQTVQLVWSGRKRMQVPNQQKVLQKVQKSEKINLQFTGHYSHCSYTVTASSYSTISSAKNVNPAIQQYPFGSRGYILANEPRCNCKLPVVIPNCFGTNNSSSKVHCLVDVSKSNDWCVGVINTVYDDLDDFGDSQWPKTITNESYLKWKGNSLSYESGTSLSLGNAKINRLKMQLDFDTNLLGFYDTGHEIEIPILICKSNYVLTRSINVGFNILEGSLSLI